MLHPSKRLAHLYLAWLLIASLASTCVIQSPAHAGEAARTDALLANGRAAFERGGYAEAAAAFREAHAAAKDAGDAQAAGRALHHLALAQQALGHYREAAESLLSGLAAIGPEGPARVRLALHEALGALYVLRQDFEEAGRQLDVAMEIAAQLDDNAARARVLANRGNLHTARVAAIRVRMRFADGEEEDEELKLAEQTQEAALDGYAEAARLAREAKEPALEARAMLNAAISARRAIADTATLPRETPEEQAAADAARRRWVQRALQLNAQAMEKVTALPDSPHKASLLLTGGQGDRAMAKEIMGNGKWRNGEWKTGPQPPAPATAPAAIPHSPIPHSPSLPTHSPSDLIRRSHASFQKAAELYRAAGDKRGESYALGFLGTLHESDGTPADALTLSRRAVFLAQNIGANESLYRWEWLRGRLLDAKGERDDAIAAYLRSAEALKDIRSDLALGFGNGDGRLSFRDEVGPVYFGLADLLLRRAADEKRSPDERRRDLATARETVELLKSAELEDYFRDPCVNQLLSPKQIDDVGQRTAVIYIVLLPDRIELLVNFSDAPASAGAAPDKPVESRGQGLQQFTVKDVPGDRLEQTVRLFRRGLEDRSSYDFKEEGRQLYKWFVEPIEPELKRRQIETLVFVPDGVLRTVPMAALFDGKEYLVQKYAVAVSPGLRLMRPEPIKREQIRALLSGLSEARQTYPALPNVEEELRQIKAVLPDSKTLLNKNFELDQVRTELYKAPYSIVHIASHGEFKGEAARTFLLTYEDRISLDALQRLIAPAQFDAERGFLPVELLTLSACQTAAGDDRAALGLAGVAIKAGARSAVASLWHVRDEAAARLIADFYRELRENPTLSKAEAMRRAQARLATDPNRQFSHPVFWAPFMVVGNWL